MAAFGWGRGYEDNVFGPFEGFGEPREIPRLNLRREGRHPGGVGEQLFGIPRAVFADFDFAAPLEAAPAVFDAKVGAIALAERRRGGNRPGADSEAAELDGAAFPARVRICLLYTSDAADD